MFAIGLLGDMKTMLGDNKLDVIDFADTTHKWLARHSQERLALYESEGKSVSRSLLITATDSGFKTSEVEQLTETNNAVAIGTIERSLFAATDAAGIARDLSSSLSYSFAAQANAGME